MGNQTPARTISEIEAMLSQHKLEDIEGFSGGMYQGFQAGMRMIQEGKSPAEIYQYAKDDDNVYRSWGDDRADEYQSGRTCAIMWCAGQYDWDENGNPIYREGNFLGEQVGQRSESAGE
jgi:hypothetical protein